MEWWQVIATRERLAGFYLERGYAVPRQAHDPKGGYYVSGYTWDCPQCDHGTTANGYGELGADILHHRETSHA